MDLRILRLLILTFSPTDLKDYNDLITMETKKSREYQSTASRIASADSNRHINLELIFFYHFYFNPTLISFSKFKFAFFSGKEQSRIF